MSTSRESTGYTSLWEKLISKVSGSLTRSFIIGVLLIALVPVVIVGISNYARSRTLLYEVHANQLKSFITLAQSQINKLPVITQQYITDIFSNNNNRRVLENLANQPESLNFQYLAAEQLLTYSRSISIPTEIVLPSIVVIDSSGKVLVTTDYNFSNKNIGNLSGVQASLITEKTIFASDQQPFFRNDIVLITSRTINDRNGNPGIYLLTFTQSPLLSQSLASLNNLFPSTNAFFYDWINLEAIGFSSQENAFVPLRAISPKFQTIRSLLNQPEGKLGEYNSDGTQVLAYAITLADFNVGIVVEVPLSVVYQEANSVLANNLFLFVGVVVIISLLLIIGNDRIINPLLQLEQAMRKFVAGDMSVRAKVTRSDELGSLSTSFNTIVDQLSALYKSLEERVRERTRQLRIASDVAQQATASTRREEVFRRTVQLVVERFNYAFASIFSVDETSNFAFLQETYYLLGDIKSPDRGDEGEVEEKVKIDSRASDLGEIFQQRVDRSRARKSRVSRGYRLPVNSNHIVARAVSKNEPQIIADLSSDPANQHELLIPEARSEIALPITLGKEILGVLEIQSVKENAFDIENIQVLETLTRQIANGLQNIRLFESAQINLEETGLLYQTSRQITQARSEEEVIGFLTEALTRTSFVSGIFSVEEDHISIIDIIDPRNPSAKSAQGITIPLLKVVSQLSDTNLVTIENLATPSDFDNILSFFNRRGCHSAAIFSVKINNNLKKIIVISSRDTAPISSVALTPFSNLIEVLTATLERFDLLSTLERRVHELQTLEKTSKAISIESDLSSLYSLLHQEISSALGKDIGFMIAIYDQKNQMIEIPYLYDQTGAATSITAFPLGEGLSSLVIKSQQPLMLVKDTERRALELGAKIVGKPAKSWIGVPLIISGNVIGILSVQDTEQEERFDENDLNLLITLAPAIASTVRNAQLLTEMKQALQAYDQERFLLNNLMANMPERIYFKDEQGNYIRASHSYASSLGIDNPEELIGKSDFVLRSQDLATGLFRREQEVLLTGKAQLENVFETTSDDGSIRWSLETLIPMFDSSETVVGLLGIDRDITSLKEAQILSDQRAQQLITAAEIARETTGTLDVNEILAKAVNLVRDRFGFYHSSIFLLDTLGEYAVLKQSTGEVGRQMIESGHRLAVGSRSIVGQSSASKNPVVINDVLNDPNYYPNPLLPDTRSELAIPLTVGDRLLGVLDVQSNKLNAFQEEDINILRILADLLAIAVLNGNLFSKTQEQLTEHRFLQQITLAASSSPSVEDALNNTVDALRSARLGDKASIFILGSDGYLTAKAASGYEEIDIFALQVSLGEGLIGQVASQRVPIRIVDARNVDIRNSPLESATLSAVAVPIVYADRLWGVLNLESNLPATFDEDDQEIVTTLGNNLGAILSNAQLVSEIRQQVERQRMLYEITGRIRRSTDIETILRTFTREVSMVMKARRAHVKITGVATEEHEPLDGNNGGSGNNGHDGIDQGKEAA